LLSLLNEPVHSPVRDCPNEMNGKNTINRRSLYRF
jgi:hypothetical protein